MPVPVPRHLTVAEVAARLDMAEHAVRRRIRQGQIRAVNVGRQYRVPETELARYLRDNAA